MCEDCDEEQEAGAEPRFAMEELEEATRLVEADLPGRPVDEEMWEVFFGAKGGSIDSQSFERMARSREAALVLLSVAHGTVRAW